MIHCFGAQVSYKNDYLLAGIVCLIKCCFIVFCATLSPLRFLNCCDLSNNFFVNSNHSDRSYVNVTLAFEMKLTRFSKRNFRIMHSAECDGN